MNEKESLFRNCLLYNSNALARVLSKAADAAFKEFGMSYSHAFILLHISKYPSAPVGELSEVLLLTPSTITRLCEKLESNGFIKRETIGRNTRISATPKATKLVPKIMQIWEQLQTDYRNAIGEEQTEKINARTIKAIKKLEKK